MEVFVMLKDQYKNERRSALEIDQSKHSKQRPNLQTQHAYTHRVDSNSLRSTINKQSQCPKLPSIPQQTFLTSLAESFSSLVVSKLHRLQSERVLLT
jgi:hypothetical protein